tara:strand:+ start:1494 stop:2543 length:1050 start_codon:yes stop_codon:yes gene_type:complete
MAVLAPLAPSSSLARIEEEASQKALNSNTSFIQKDSYIIGPGDILDLVIFDAPNLSGELKVLNDGSVGLPLIGSKFLSGMTLSQATTFVQTELSSELLRPELQLKVAKPRAILVSVIGEIQRPGLYSLSNERNSSSVTGSGGLISGLPTVINAIQAAGGITQTANLRKVVLQRRLPGSNTKYKKTHLDLLSLVLKGDQVQNPFLFDGDIISLVKAKALSEEEISLSSANLSPQTITVNIIGEVNNPGAVRLKANTPISQAVLAAGGPVNWRSSQGNVDLVRINRNGSATLNQYKIDLSQKISAQNPPLKNGDTVRVKRNAYAKTNDAIKSVSEPLTGLVTIYSLFRLIN